MLNDEYRYKILSALNANQEISQRELARRLGISLGKINYCINALVQKGMVKVDNFKNSANKRGCSYLLTPQGLEDKTAAAVKLLRYKENERAVLSREIEKLRAELQSVDFSAHTKIYCDEKVNK